MKEAYGRIVSSGRKTGFSGFLATVQKKGLGLEPTVALHSKRPPGRAAN